MKKKSLSDKIVNENIFYLEVKETIKEILDYIEKEDVLNVWGSLTKFIKQRVGEKLI